MDEIDTAAARIRRKRDYERVAHKMGRRFRWARRNAGFATAAAYARAVGISAGSARRFEREGAWYSSTMLKVMLPLCEGTLLSLDRLFLGRKPDPTSLMGRVRAGDPQALAELRADGPEGARLADLAETWLNTRQGRA